MKKRIGRRARVILASALACVSLMGVGGTLAYLNTTSNQLTNTFVAGTSAELTLDEHVATYDAEKADWVFATDDSGEITAGMLSAEQKAEENDLTYAGVQTYDMVIPGSEIAKDPTLTWKWDDAATSAKHYVYIEVLDSLKTANVVKNTYYSGSDQVDAHAISYATGTGVSGYSWKALTGEDGKNVAGPNTTGSDTTVYVLWNDTTNTAAEIDSETEGFDNGVGFIEGNKITVNGFYKTEDGKSEVTTEANGNVKVHVEAITGGSLQFWGYMCQAGTFDGDAAKAFTTVFSGTAAEPTSNWKTA